MAGEHVHAGDWCEVCHDSGYAEGYREGRQSKRSEAWLEAEGPFTEAEAELVEAWLEAEGQLTEDEAALVRAEFAERYSGPHVAWRPETPPADTFDEA